MRVHRRKPTHLSRGSEGGAGQAAPGRHVDGVSDLELERRMWAEDTQDCGLKGLGY